MSPTKLAGWPAKCGTCRFYATGNGDADAQGMGVCRRNPPQGIPVPVDAAPGHIPTMKLVGAWPHISPEQVCGEWQMQGSR